jgi:hypothetical protein
MDLPTNKGILAVRSGEGAIHCDYRPSQRTSAENPAAYFARSWRGPRERIVAGNHFFYFEIKVPSIIFTVCSTQFSERIFPPSIEAVFFIFLIANGP